MNYAILLYMVLRRYFSSVFVLITLACLLVTAANAALPAAPQTLRFTVQDLGSLPFVADEVSPGLSDNGTVSLWQDGPEAVQGAVWRSGTRESLGAVAGYPSSMTRALNSFGEEAGWTSTSANSVDSRAITRACCWHKNTLILLGTLGGQNSQAFGINANGTVVGVAQCADRARHAFSAQGGSLHDLGTLPGGDFSQAYAISDSGMIVGASTGTSPYKHAVCWRNGRIFDLGLLPGGMSSSAQAVNRLGQVAGYADMPDGTRAFLYSQGKMQDLGTLGFDPSNANGLNDRGQVVGAAGVSANGRHAFLWQNGVMTDLNTLLIPHSPWVLLQAYAINHRCQVVCVGHRKGEPSHLLLLTPSVNHYSK